ncbi:hypothetical protein ACFWA5_18910 [Streptomyces mirabilis]|uniref:hypothetical protein n=1 Tax=Streptomyces mirabilis TaxID=68239 RepID=UPI00364A5BA5
MRGLTTLAPEPTFVNTDAHTVRCPFVSLREAGAAMDVSFLGGPRPRRGIGVSEHETLGDAVRALNAVAPEAVAYAWTSGSFVGGVAVTAGSPLRMNAGREWPGCRASAGRRDVMSVELT